MIRRKALMGPRAKRLSRISLASFSICAVASAGSYVVRPGDTLSKIAQKSLMGPVWGAAGSLSQILALNPQITDPNLIRPGQQISTEAVAPRLALQVFHPNEELPASVRTPASDETEIVDQSAIETPMAHGRFSVRSDFYSTKILASDLSNNSLATLLSKSNAGIALSYSQVFSEHFETSLFFAARRLTMQSPATGGTLSNAAPNLYNFGATAQTDVAKRLQLEFGIASVSEAYLRGVSLSTVSLDTISSLQLSSSLKYDFLEVDPFVLSTEFGAALKAPANYGNVETLWNPSYVARLNLRQDLNADLSLDAGFEVLKKTQDTSLAEQSQTDFGIYLQVSVALGRKSNLYP